MIKTLDDNDTIWQWLKDAYGDAKVMLSRKLQEIQKLDVIKTNNAEKLTSELSKVINVMLDAKKLCKEHHIEEYLYYGDGFTKICHLIGYRRTTRFLSSTREDNPAPKEMWHKLIAFPRKGEESAPDENAPQPITSRQHQQGREKYVIRKFQTIQPIISACSFTPTCYNLPDLRVKGKHCRPRTFSWSWRIQDSAVFHKQTNLLTQHQLQTETK